MTLDFPTEVVLSAIVVAAFVLRATYPMKDRNTNHAAASRFARQRKAALRAATAVLR